MQRKPVDPLLRSVLAATALLGAWVAPGGVGAQVEPEAPAPRDPEASSEIPTDKTASLTVLFTTDVYGRFRAVGCGPPTADPDFANLLAAVDQIRHQLKGAGRLDPLLVSTGNNIGPQALARFLLAQGDPGAKSLTAWLARAGYDYIALGHQDFRSMPQRMRLYLETGAQAGLHFGGANLTCPDAAAGMCQCLADREYGFHMVARGPLKVALVAVVGPALLEDLPAANLVGFAVEDALERTTAAVGAAREAGADVVIVVAHLDLPESAPKYAMALARSVKGVDLVLANGFAADPEGKSLSAVRFLGERPLVAGTDLFLRHLGRVDLTLRQRGGRFRVTELQVEPVSLAEVTPEPGMRAELLTAVASYCDKWHRPVGKGQLPEPMTAGVFAAYLLEIMRVTTHSELAFVHPELVKGEQVFPLEGAITSHDFFAGMPHRHPLYTFTMTTGEVKQLCESVLREGEGKGTVGLRMRGLDCEAPIRVNGRPIESGDTFEAVTVELLAKGRGGFFAAQAGRMRHYHPSERSEPPVLGEIAREFLAGPVFDRTPTAPIDATVNFPDLSRQLRWVLQGDVQLSLADTRIRNKPAHEESQLTRDELMSFRGELRGKVNASSRLHGLAADVRLKYAQNSTNQDDFMESDDLTTLLVTYQLHGFTERRWWLPIPFVEGRAETELTRPEEVRDYHHLELTGTLGVGFELLTQLSAKTGFAVRREMFDPESKPIPGVETSYDLTRLDLFSVFGGPVQVESSLTWFYGNFGKDGAIKGTWSNHLYFGLVGSIYFSVSHQLFWYRTSGRRYGLASDLLFGLNYHTATSIQTF